jgi:transcriptional regulator with XRE-family HTH domain
MVADKTTALGKQLGRELRIRREKAGYNALELSRRLGWSPTKVSRVETGSRDLTATDLTMYLASCGVPRDEINEIIELSREGDKGYRLKDHADTIRDENSTLIFHEQSATAIDSYDPILIPPLAQTERYTRALLIETGTNSSSVVEHRMQCLANRQATIRQSDPPHCTFLIHENAITTMVGDNLVMNEQLLHLAFLTAWHRCTIRVVPRSAGAAGLTKNSFQRMLFPDHDPVTVVDLETNSLFLDNPSDTTRYASTLKRLDRVALEEDLSRTVLADLADDFDRQGSVGQG